MNKIRTALAGTALAISLTAGLLGTATAADAAVATSTGAHANTTLVCQRLSGAYSLGTANQGFEYARQYLYNTTTGLGSWGGWVAPSQLERYFSLPSRGTVNVYVQYADWTGSSWQYTGEWAKVYNARGQFVSNNC